MTTVLALKNKQKSIVSKALILRAQGAYVGLAIGDALGATTEFMTPNEIKNQYGVHHKIMGGGWLKLKSGQVTDDTEMSLTLGKSILQNKGVKADAVAEAFSEWMRSKPIDIGHTVRRGLMHYRTTKSTQVPVNEHDAGNGACMRSLPIALYYWDAPYHEVLQASRIQSHTTHNNPVADAGTETVIRMVIAALKGNKKIQLKDLADQLILRFPQYQYDCKPVTNPSGWIIETLQVVFQAFFKHDNFESILVDVVNRGGDADTTGAIAGMLAGAHYGFESLKPAWVNALDNNILQQCLIQSDDLVCAQNAFIG